MKTLATAMAVLLAAGAAHANDTVAETSAGGLVLSKSAEIDMVSEDLFVSAEQIRVRYVFRNRSERDIRTTVAFPMPDLDLAERDSDVAHPYDFATRVNGQPVRMQVERKAVLRGADHTALLTSLRVPLVNPADGPSQGVTVALDALPPAEQQRLIRLGLAEAGAYDEGRGMERHLLPLWAVRETWHWDQAFPAGRDLVVEHSYTPGTGGSLATPLASPEFRRSPEGRRMISDYCIDDQFLGGITRLARAAEPGQYPMLGEKRVGYILTTGANWRSPIGDFRLVVDKGVAENLVSFCGTGLRRISPTRFEMRRSNWRPDRDLRVLIVEPHRSGI